MTNRAIASLVCPSYVDSWEAWTLEEEILAYADLEPAKNTLLILRPNYQNER
jgi:hypothetical protein